MLLAYRFVMALKCSISIRTGEKKFRNITIGWNIEGKLKIGQLKDIHL
jgi:hypothetical protein